MSEGNKTTLILAALFAIGLMAYFWLSPKNLNTSLGNTAEFSIQDTNVITRIVISEVEKNMPIKRLKMQKSATGEWKLNDKYRVLEPQLHYFFKTLSQVKVKQKLNIQGNVNAMKAINNGNITVELWAGEDKVKMYEIGPEAKDHDGSLARIKGAEEAFIVSIPGAVGVLTNRFPVEEAVWRENLLFDAHLEKIQEISLTCKDAAKSFSFVRGNVANSWKKDGITVDSTVYKPYLRHFSRKIYAESYATQNFPTKYIELKAIPADFVLKITYLDGKTVKIPLYIRTDSNNSFFAWIEGDEQLLTVQHFVMDRFINPQGLEVLQW